MNRSLVIILLLCISLFCGCSTLFRKQEPGVLPGIDRPYTKLERLDNIANETGKLMRRSVGWIFAQWWDGLVESDDDKVIDTDRLFREGYGFRRNDDS